MPEEWPASSFPGAYLDSILRGERTEVCYSTSWQSQSSDLPVTLISLLSSCTLTHLAALLVELERAETHPAYVHKAASLQRVTWQRRKHMGLTRPFPGKAAVCQGCWICCKQVTHTQGPVGTWWNVINKQCGSVIQHDLWLPTQAAQPPAPFCPPPAASALASPGRPVCLCLHTAGYSRAACKSWCSFHL